MRTRERWVAMKAVMAIVVAVPSARFGHLQEERTFGSVNKPEPQATMKVHTTSPSMAEC